MKRETRIPDDLRVASGVSRPNNRLIRLLLHLRTRLGFTKASESDRVLKEIDPEQRPGHDTPREFAFASAFLILGLLAFFPGIFFRAQDFLLRDLAALDVPLRHILVECTRTSGWPPLWNPFSAGGQPLAANPHLAVFHPLSFLFFVLPWHWAFSLQFLLPLAAGFFGMFVFLRRMNCSAIPALFGALAWTFGGYGLSLANLLPMLWTTAPLPWALNFVLQLVDDPSSPADSYRRRQARPAISAIIGLSLSLALIFLGAEPQSIMACCAVIGLVAVFRLSWSGWRSRLVGLGLSTVLSLGLAACILLPGIGLTLKTIRGTRMASPPNGVWSLPAPRLIELVTPPFTPWPETPTADAKPSHPLYPKQGAPLVGSLYCGPAVAVFAIFGFFGRFRKHILETSLIVIGIAMSLGRASPLWSMALSIPIMRVGRYPEKWSLLLVLGMILCATQTLNRILAERDPKKRKNILLSILGIGAVLLLFRIGADTTGFHPTADTYALQIFFSLCLGFLFLPLILSSSHTKRLRQGLVLSAFLFLLAGFAIDNSHLLPTREMDTLVEIPAFLSPITNSPHAARLFHLAYLRTQRTTDSWMAPPPSTAIWNIRTIFERDPDVSLLKWSNQAREMNLDFIGNYPQLTTRELARYGVGFIAELLNRRAADPSQLAVGLAPVPNPEPLISCVDRVMKIQKMKEWSDATLDALSENSSSFIVVKGGPSELPEKPSSCDTHLLSMRPDRLDFTVDAKGPDLSVVQVNQTWDPGWRLEVDGVQEQLFQNDICFSSFALSPGRHRVILEYHDPLVSVGIGITALTALLILILFGIYLRRQQSPDRYGATQMEATALSSFKDEG